MAWTPKGRTYEHAVLALILGSGLLTALALSVLVADPRVQPGLVARAAGAGVLLIALSIAASHPLSLMVSLRPRDHGSAEYDQMRHYGQLKAAAILLNLLAILGVISIAFGLAVRAGHLNVGTPHPILMRIAAGLGGAILLTLIHTHIQSLRIPLQRTTTIPIGAFHLIAVAASAALGLVGILIADRQLQLGGLQLGPRDAPLVLLAGLSAASFNLFISRPLPSLFNLFRSDKTPYQGRDYISRAKSVLLPAAIAFAFLFLVVFVLLVVGIGSAGVAGPLPFAIIGFVFIALLASMLVSAALARTPDTFELYHVKTSPESRTGQAILYTSIAIALLLGTFGVLLLRGQPVPYLRQAQWVDLFALAILVAVGPYGFYYNRRATRIRRLEERFPDFLRDVAASHRGGLTLTASVQMAAKGEYADLTPEIRRMADQLSWNIPFNEALERLKERVRTPLIERAITLIIEASRSGGNTTDVLLAAARDAREIKNLENERRATMSLYSIIIYVTFLVFLGVAAVIYGQFVPQLIHSAQIAERAGGVGGLASGTPTKEQYRAFFFTAATMQGLGNGLVGGLFQHGRVLAGLRHAFVMVLMTYVAFNFIFP